MDDTSNPVEAIRDMKIPDGMVASEELRAFIIAKAPAWKDGESGGADTWELLRLVTASHMEVLDALGRLNLR